jgi:hypothetical protein
VCAVLDALLDFTLESRGFAFQRAVVPREEAVGVEEVAGAEGLVSRARRVFALTLSPEL